VPDKLQEKTMQTTLDRDQRCLDSKLIHAVRKDRLNAVADLLAEGADPSAVEVRSLQIFGLGRVKGACDSALISAARLGTASSHEIMRLLIAAGADTGYRNHYGELAGDLIAAQRADFRKRGINSTIVEFLTASLNPERKQAAG
jgi:hypothetical protein